MSITRTLSWQDVITAGTIGFRRRVYMMTKGKGIDERTRDPEVFETSEIAAMAELVVARELNLFWRGNIETPFEPDVGGKVEVRARRKNQRPDLAIKDWDKKQFPFVLVHADVPHFTIVGWIDGHEAWRIAERTSLDWLRFVPHSTPPLREMSELVEMLRDEPRDVFPGDVPLKAGVTAPAMNSPA